MPQIRKHVSGLLCLLILAITVAGGQTDVLCLGEDGHAEFETACLPCCVDGDENCSIDRQPGHHEEHRDCTNCTDVSIYRSTTAQRSSDLYALDVNLAGTSHPVHAASTVYSTASLCAHHGAPFLPATSSRSSDNLGFTVLLI